MKTGISGSTRRIVRGVREHCLGRILCTCDVQVRRHRRLRRRQAVHTSLHVGVALKSGLVVGIVQLLDDVQRVVSSSTSARLARTTRSARCRSSRSIRPPTAASPRATPAMFHAERSCGVIFPHVKPTDVSILQPIPRPLPLAPRTHLLRLKTEDCLLELARAEEVAAQEAPKPDVLLPHGQVHVTIKRT